ncbi:hypothetical protein D3C77_569050 [compost metagenome]
MKTAVSNYVNHARRVNHLVVMWKRQGDLCKARYCKGYRNQWMAEARNAATQPAQEKHHA